jgi:hypothetical protein
MMQKRIGKLALVAVAVSAALAYQTVGAGSSKAAGTEWSLDATYIEACSCHLFCPCYFNPHPEHEYCEFNMAVVVNDGKVGDVSLKGARYWLTGDLGDNFGDGKTPWLIITFDPKLTQAQRDALTKVLGKIYPVEWDKVEFDESAFTWEITEKEARAKLANGKGEMILEQWAGNDGGKSTLHNVKYFGADTNDGFVMYKSKVHRWDGFGKKFDYSGRNAFTIRLRSSGTFPAAAAD